MAYTDDPWAVSDNEEDVAMVGGTLDIMDESEDEHVRTAPPLHSNPGWITQQKRQAFLHGCPYTDHQAKAQAYQALRIPSAVQSYLGLDINIGMCRISDVRLQPVDRDPGYPATQRQGHGPDTAAIVACLLMHKELIEACGMIYLIVDNRAGLLLHSGGQPEEPWSDLSKNALMFCGCRQLTPTDCEQSPTTGPEFLCWKQLDFSFPKCILG